RIGDGRSNANVGNLRTTFGAERVRRLAQLHHHRLDVGYIEDRRSAQIEEPLIERSAGSLVEIKTFAQSIAEALCGATQDLAFDNHRIDRTTHVVGRHQPEDLNLAGLDIDFDLRKCRREAVREQTIILGVVDSLAAEGATCQTSELT